MKASPIFRSLTPSRLLFSSIASVVLVAGRLDAAAVASVDWDNSDATADGVITGTLGGIPVTLTTGTGSSGGTPFFPENGGVFLDTGTNWSLNQGSDGVPGISEPGVVNEAAVIDMGLASEGRTVISFSEPITNPTVLINFVHDNYVQFDFDPSMPLLTLVDAAGLPGGTVPSGIGDGMPLVPNIVFVNASVGDNTADSGFAVRLTGIFSEIGFDTSPGVNGLDEQTVAVTVVATVPEPSSFALVLLSAVGVTMARRRNSR